MDHRFKADLYGWLEYQSRLTPFEIDLPKDRLPIELLTSFDATLSYYDHSKEALKALHDVVFYATLHHPHYATDFDAPRFESGMDHHILYHVGSYFNLHAYTVREVASMPSKTAFDFIDRTFKQLQKPLRYFHRLTIKIIQRWNGTEEEVESVRDWLRDQFMLDDDLESLPEHLELILETVYACIDQNKQRGIACQRLESVLQDIQSLHLPMTPTSQQWIYLMLPTEKDTPSTIQISTVLSDHQRKREDNLMNKWHHSQKDHQAAFTTICSHFRQKGLTTTRQSEKNELKALEDRLRQQSTDDVNRWKLYCCLVIANRSDHWVSLLKVMTQFIDLWIEDLAATDCIDAYVQLIVQNDMVSILLDKIHVHLDDTVLAKRLCQVLLECMNQSNLDQLLQLLDSILCHPSLQHDQSPTFHSTDLWGFSYQAQLRKTLNQITIAQDEDHLTPPLETMHALTQLMIIWPYATLNALMASCVQHKHQFKAILPIFLTFKDICQPHISFISLFKEQMTLKMQSDYDPIQENTLQCVHACLSAPASLLVTQRMGLFDLNELMERLVIPTLQHGLSSTEPSPCSLHLTRFSLAFLCSITHDWPEDILERYLQIHEPQFFQSSISLLADVLTRLVNERQEPISSVIQMFQLQDWELAITSLERLVKVCSCAIRLGQLSDVHQVMMSTLEQCAWQTQLFWVSIRPDIPQLNQVSDDCVVFEACKLSTFMTDRLLVPPLSPMWLSHPSESTMILKGFQAVLYPQPCLTVASEYPRLIHYFLMRLYDLSDGMDRIIRDYPSSEQIRPIMQQLNQEDMKLYFVVLYTTQLLMEHTKQMHSPNSSDLYYFTHLIKMIQQLKEWHDITQKGQSVSYVSLKKTLKNNSHPWLSTEHVFDQPRLIQHSHMLYYPLLRPHLISERALSILTLYHLSLICLELHEGDVRDVVKRLMLYITEGLMDMNSRQQFQRMLNQQPKSRISQWKKKVKSGEMAMVMKMRPCLLKEEEALLMPLLRQSEQMHDLIEALETNDSLFTSILYFP